MAALLSMHLGFKELNLAIALLQLRLRLFEAFIGRGEKPLHPCHLFLRGLSGSGVARSACRSFGLAIRRGLWRGNE